MYRSATQTTARKWLSEAELINVAHRGHDNPLLQALEKRRGRKRII
ncbi:hypothetical protein [Carnimonas bestiolae]